MTSDVFFAETKLPRVLSNVLSASESLICKTLAWKE